MDCGRCWARTRQGIPGRHRWKAAGLAGVRRTRAVAALEKAVRRAALGDCERRRHVLRGRTRLPVRRRSTPAFRRKPEEPRFFVLAVGGKPGGFGLARGLRDRPSESSVVVRSQDVAISPAGVRAHGGRIQAEPQVGAALPVAQVVPRRESLAGRSWRSRTGARPAAASRSMAGLVHAGDGVVGRAPGRRDSARRRRASRGRGGNPRPLRACRRWRGERPRRGARRATRPRRRRSGRASPAIRSTLRLSMPAARRRRRSSRTTARRVQATALVRFAVDEGLDAQADAVDAGVGEGVEGGVGDLAGSALRR